MGEYADMHIDMMLNGDWIYDDEPRNRLRRRPVQIKTCQRCGERNLRWGNVKGGHWRLFTVEGELHNCIPTESAVERYYGKAGHAKWLCCKGGRFCGDDGCEGPQEDIDFEDIPF